VTVNADELEQLIERLSAELARGSSRRAVIVRPPERGYARAITIVATAVGVVCCCITFALSRAAPRTAPLAPAPAASIAAAPPEAIMIAPAPAPTLPVPSPPTPPSLRVRDHSYVRDL